MMAQDSHAKAGPESLRVQLWATIGVVSPQEGGRSLVQGLTTQVSKRLNNRGLTEEEFDKEVMLSTDEPFKGGTESKTAIHLTIVHSMHKTMGRGSVIRRMVQTPS